MAIDREALREKVARAMAERDNWVWDKLSDEPQPWDDYNEGKNWWRDIADAALSALDQPAQEPVTEGTRQVERVVFGRETGEVFATGYHRVTPQPAQEPVAWMVTFTNGRRVVLTEPDPKDWDSVTPLYVAR